MLLLNEGFENPQKKSFKSYLSMSAADFTTPAIGAP